MSRHAHRDGSLHRPGGCGRRRPRAGSQSRHRVGPGPHTAPMCAMSASSGNPPELFDVDVDQSRPVARAHTEQLPAGAGAQGPVRASSSLKCGRPSRRMMRPDGRRRASPAHAAMRAAPTRRRAPECAHLPLDLGRGSPGYPVRAAGSIGKSRHGLRCGSGPTTYRHMCASNPAGLRHRRHAIRRPRVRPQRVFRAGSGAH